ncbi:MAG: type 1 glutamine amidotransferase [Duodenibacillus sp.]|nr:type 1 glutamine amidotransferase [Duodenibacillus sp.]
MTATCSKWEFAMKIHIVTCDDFAGWFPSPWHPYVSLFSRIEPGLEFALCSAVRGELPASPEPGALYVIGGSRSSAYEKESWILDLLEWIRLAHAQGAILAGICFGHQALCEALGGRVARAPEWWVGRRTARVTSEKLARVLTACSGGHARSLTLHCHHHDQVVQLPPGAEVLAASDFCPVEAFVLAESVIGFQGHPEFSVETMRFLLREPLEGFSPEQRRKAIAGMDSGPQQGLLPHGKAVAELILGLAR